MQIGELFLKLRADGSGLEGDVEAAGQNAANRLRQVFGAAAIGAALKSSIDAASNLQQAVGGTEAIFGSATATIDRYAETSVDAMGMSERAFREATTQIGGQLRGMGFELEEAAQKSVQLTQLGADLAATFGGSTEEAVTALSAALRGEYDPLERYGVGLRATDVAARAVALGLADSTSEVDNQARAQATLSLIMEQSAGAQGQFAREADTAAGAQARAVAEAENSAASLGENFLPIYTRIVSVVGSVAEAFGSLPGFVQTGIVALAGIAALSGPISTLRDMGSALRPLAEGLLDRAATGAYGLAGNLGTVGLAAGGVVGALGLLAGVYAVVQARNQEAEERTNSYSEALERQAEAGEAAGRAALAETISEALDVDTAERYGISMRQITDAITGQGDAYERLRAQREELEALGGGLDAEQIGRLATIDAILAEADAYRDAQGAQEASNEQSREGAEVQEALGDTFALTAEQIDAVNDALDEYLGRFLDLPEAQRELAAAADEAFSTLVENGVTAFNDLTEAGRENRDVLDGIVSSTTDVVRAQLDQNASSGEILGTIDSQIARLQQLRDTGLITAETFDFYVGILRGIPETVSTEVEVPGLSAADLAVRNFRTNVLGIPPDRHTTVFAETTLAEERVRLFEERLANLPTTKTVFIEAIPKGPAYAEGTSSAERGMALVGEYGPELVVFGGGERVIPHQQTAAMLAQAGGSSTPVADPAAMERAVQRGIAAALRGMAMDGREMYLALSRAGNDVEAWRR